MMVAVKAGVALATSLLTVLAFAQGPTDFPKQPIKLVVTFPPGGSSDTVVRMIAPRMQEVLGQPIIIDNRPGAGGNIGLTAVAKAPADGYTLGLGAAGALAANSSLYAQMPYDVDKDFRPVGMVAAIPFVLVGNPSLRARSLRELISMAKGDPGRMTVGHGGNGTAMHLSVALFEQMAGVKLVEIPYKGTGPAVLDALGGQVSLAMADLPASLQQIRAGKLIAYAVTSPQRSPELPDVPTMAEAGLTGYDSTGWFGVVAPAGTPDTVITRVNAAMNDALGDPAAKTAIRKLGAEPSADSPMAFGAYISSETRKWARVVKEGNIKLD